MSQHSLLRSHYHRQAIMLMVAVLGVWIFAALYLFSLGPKPGQTVVPTDVQLIQGISVALAMFVLVLTAFAAQGRPMSLLVNSIGHAMVFVALLLGVSVNAGDGVLASPTMQGIAAIAALFAVVATVGSATAFQRLRMLDLTRAEDKGANLAAMPGMKPASIATAPDTAFPAAPALPDGTQKTLAAGIERAFAPSGQTLIRVENLTKHYGPTRAVNGISFTIDRGEIVGFLGPNGAGKSTTMKILTTYLKATGGRVQVAGHEVRRHPVAVRERLGYLPEANPLYREMRVEGYLDFIAQARHIPLGKRAANLAWVREACGLQPVWQMRINELSKGYRQRVGLAQAIIHEPDILILDEPSSGLDPNQIIEIRELIRDLGRNRTIILSTHILQEVTAMCSRVMIIDQGRLVANGTAEDLCRAMSPVGIFKLRVDGDGEKVQKSIAGVNGVSRAEWAPKATGEPIAALSVSVDADITDANAMGIALANAVKSANASLVEMRNERPSLEDVFVTLTHRTRS